MGAGPLVPPQKLRNEWVSRIKGWIVSRGRKWYGYFRRTIFDPITGQQKSDVVSVILGSKSQMKPLILIVPPTLMTIGVIFVCYRRRNQERRTEHVVEAGQDW